MNREDRRAAMTAYKERKTPAGIYALRCAATGQCWVGGAVDLGAIENRHRFALRQGANRHRSLQEAWNRHGEASFTFERVETFADDMKDYVRDSALKERLLVWKKDLQAETI